MIHQCLYAAGMSSQSQHNKVGCTSNTTPAIRPTQPVGMHAKHTPQASFADVSKQKGIAKNGRQQSHQHYILETSHAKHQVLSQADGHLAALKAQGELESIARPFTFARPARVEESTHQQRRPGVSLAAVHGEKPHTQPVTDMFGVATVDNTEGTGMGLIIMRPASSLW